MLNTYEKKNVFVNVIEGVKEEEGIARNQSWMQISVQWEISTLIGKYL